MSITRRSQHPKNVSFFEFNIYLGKQSNIGTSLVLGMLAFDLEDSKTCKRLYSEIFHEAHPDKKFLPPEPVYKENMQKSKAKNEHDLGIRY